MAIHSKVYGPKDPHVAADLSNWAMLRMKLGNYEVAEEMFRAVLQIQEEASGRIIQISSLPCTDWP
jgi:tetratricopeptide (TPR) repeat protein